MGVLLVILSYSVGANKINGISCIHSCYNYKSNLGDEEKTGSGLTN